MRDRRRFGPGPYVKGMRREGWSEGFPYDVPAVAAIDELDLDSEGIYSPDLSLYGGVPLHQQSHGQSFLALAANRFGGESLYVLDEPEAALSVSGALALVAIVVRAAAAGAQFVIATHSPILLATPGARIYELDERGIAACAYDELDTVRLMRGFLDAPERYLRAALGE